jgi:hypothetical protein
MTHEFPTPSEIFEELADKTALQIDRLAPVAFDQAFKEMLRYHRFLLTLNASRTPEGAAFSYAELTGDAWSAPHREWIRQYRRLFDRAMDKLPDDDSFIKSLTYAPGRLLRAHGDVELSPTVVRSILDLATIMIHRMEAWLAKRTTVAVSEGEDARPRAALSGADAKTYTDVLHEVVGAWEDIVQQVPSIYRWPERGDQDPQRSWSAFAASWPFLWQHLSNTAYCLAAAVWNEDEAAGVLFRESLLRWRNTLAYRLEDPAELRRRLLFPDILKLGWTEASERAARLAYDYMPPPSPDQLFTTILEGAHQDALLLTSALLLFWSTDKNQASDIAGRMAASLLRKEGTDEDDHRTDGPLDFRSLFIDLLRLDLASGTFRGESYSGELDGLVGTLDNMTERHVVPGRIFSPSTLNARGDLLQSFAAMLGCLAPAEGDDGVVEMVAELAKEEEILPEGDRSLRDIVRQLGHLDAFLEKPEARFSQGLAVLAPDRDAEAAAGQLRRIIGAARNAIEDLRLERLKARPVDPGKLERVRSAIEAALLNQPSQAAFFRDVQVGRTSAGEDANSRDISFDGISKAQWTEPPMETPPSGLAELLVSRSREQAGGHAWDEFRRRPRIAVDVRAGPDRELFWQEIAPLVAEVGPDPVIVLSQTAEGAAMRRLMRAAPSDRPSLKFERRSRESRGGSYLGTMEGVDLFAAKFTAGVAWLFSAKALLEVRYAEIESAQFVKVVFDPGEETTGTLRVHLRNYFHWSDAPIFEIRFPKQEAKSGGRGGGGA